MVFKNLRTGNILNAIDPTVIAEMQKQPEVYVPYKPDKAADKPTETAADTPEETKAEKPVKPTKGKTK